MAKKFEWTPELEDALLKSNFSEERIAEIRAMPVDDVKMLEIDVEKLDLDSLDAVSGGAFGWGNEVPPDDWKCPTLRYMTLPEGRDWIWNVDTYFGRDVCIDWCMDFFQFYTNAWEESLNAGGPNYCADVIWGIHWKYTHK